MVFSLRSEMDNSGLPSELGVARATMERSQETDTVSLEHRGTITSPGTPPTTPKTAINPALQISSSSVGRSQTRREERSGNTLYQELSFQVC